MTEKQGASTRLMYQIYVALHRKEVTVHIMNYDKVTYVLLEDAFGQSVN